MLLWCAQKVDTLRFTEATATEMVMPTKPVAKKPIPANPKPSNPPSPLQACTWQKKSHLAGVA
jgi:hypothetical protein